MTEYFLVNNQDYFAAGYIVSNGGVYVDTTAGLGTAVATKTDNPADAKTELYRQVQANAAQTSERTELTASEHDRITAKLDEQFKVVSTDELQSC
jgi:hypothetical protein